MVDLGSPEAEAERYEYYEVYQVFFRSEWKKKGFVTVNLWVFITIIGLCSWSHPRS